MATDSEIAYGELRGFLEAFARLNDKADHSYTFTFDWLPKPQDIGSAIKAWFDGQATKVATTLIEEWSPEVRNIFRRWLFQYQVSTKDHLVDPNNTFSLSHDSGREALLDHVMMAIGRVVQPLSVWKVNVETIGFYECAWEDIAFEGADFSYLLHLGVSD
jgi:hypothetical protein